MLRFSKSPDLSLPEFIYFIYAVTVIKLINIYLMYIFFTAIAEEGKSGGELPKVFFKEEYWLNNLIGLFLYIVLLASFQLLLMTRVGTTCTG